MVTQDRDLIGMDTEQFITAMTLYAQWVKTHGYPASLFLAQSILESKHGQSDLTLVNNLWRHKFKNLILGFMYHSGKQHQKNETVR